MRSSFSNQARDLPFFAGAGGQGALARAGAFASNGVVQDFHRSPGGAAPTSLDGLLLAVGRRRDRLAFAALFDDLAPRLKTYLCCLGSDPQTAEELVQEVMLQVWCRAETFDPGKSSVNTWVFAIARNKRIDAFRRERRPEIDPSDPALIPEPAEPADRALETAQATGQLQAALEELPPDQGELLRLAFFEDKSHSVIASERGLPLGTVKARLRSALERLRKALGNPP